MILTKCNLTREYGYKENPKSPNYCPAFHNCTDMDFYIFNCFNCYYKAMHQEETYHNIFNILENKRKRNDIK